jgi:ABC-type transporter Mla MlaB component
MTGQKDRFDSVAIDFASRYARSAPVWFSAPELLGRKGLPTLSAGDSKSTATFTWICPEELSLASLSNLQTVQQQAVAELLVDWRLLKTLPSPSLGPLAAMFANWCESAMTLRFSGAECLDRALKTITPSGDKRISPLNWQLRMDALRVMRMQDEFELVALEYCVTYEVSPPSWQNARSNCTLDSAPVVSAAVTAALPSSQQEDVQANAMVELTGEIVGDAADALTKLRAAMDDSNQLVISCARLIRVDFSAAGSILNWVAARQSEGCRVQFRDVNRMVAAFFGVIGIHEHALVVARNS